MRVLNCTRRARTFLSAFGAIAAALLLAWPSAVPAEASEATLEAAQQEREAVEQRLDEVLARLDQLQAQTAEVEQRVADLRKQAAEHEQSAHRASKLMAAHVEDVYKHGRMPIALAFFSSGEVTEAVDRARVLTLIAQRNNAEAETAGAASLRADASADQVASAVKVLESHEAELAAAREDVQAALAEAQAREDEIRDEIAAQEAAAAARAARERAARSSSVATTSTATTTATATTGAAVSGGIACPVGSPRSYSDTFGAPRSGGRSHMGTDILAPSGTPSYAYESGTIDRMSYSSLGGISLYMTGDSGNYYYYTHLSGYAATSAAGKRVAAGELIAYVGDTGNAAGIPHLHFEVMPGGGSNVNPYPYVLRACG
jgi:murein DD-endopeptidase MepM/ murein hydrolase activator NlpD